MDTQESQKERQRERKRECILAGEATIEHKERRLDELLHVGRHEAEARLCRKLLLASLGQPPVGTEAHILHRVDVPVHERLNFERTSTIDFVVNNEKLRK